MVKAQSSLRVVQPKLHTATDRPRTLLSRYVRYFLGMGALFS